MSDLPDVEREEPVVRDKRRFNPDGSARTPDPSADTDESLAPKEPESPGVAAEDPRVAELTDTLKRLKAEYDNYRRRTGRERQAVTELATAKVLEQLLPVLDDVERARAHGDLTGAFGAVGEALVSVATKLGLESYGKAGDAFDPQVHDAVLQAPPQTGVAVPVAAEVFRPGFRFAGRVLRPAQVAVAEPAEEPGRTDSSDVVEGGDGPAAPTPEE